MKSRIYSFFLRIRFLVIKSMNLNIIKSIILLFYCSSAYAESITIYADQSAAYHASDCCTLNSIGYNNSNTLNAGSCLYWSQYDACERRQSYPIWSFNFTELPSNSTLINASFQAVATYDEWHDSYMSISSETGTISTLMGSNLVSGGDWSIDGQVWTWWNQGLNIYQELPVSGVELGISTGQLNVSVHTYNGSIENSGLDAPKLVLEYQILESECSDIHEGECGDDNDCQWVEDIEYGSCGNLNPSWSTGAAFCNDPSVTTDQCYTYTCYGGSYGSWSTCCGGDPYVIANNSYCEEIEVLECSEMNQLQCTVDDSCEWVESIQWYNCSNFNLSDECNSYSEYGCYTSWNSTTWQDDCNGPSFQINNSFCQELSFILGDTNGDGSLNIADIILIVDLILSGGYNEVSDFNQDGILNIIDVIEVVNFILNI